MSHTAVTSRLEQHIGAIERELARLSAPAEWKALTAIMHRPGWTTPAEAIFAETVLEHMAGQIATLTALKTRLIDGCEAVVVK